MRNFAARRAFAELLASAPKVPIINGTDAPVTTSQWLTIRPCAPAKKKARARPDRLSPPLAPEVSQAERATRSALSLSFSMSPTRANSSAALAARTRGIAGRKGDEIGVELEL